MFFRAGGSDKWVRAGGVWVCVCGSETNLKHLKHLKVLERQRFPC